MTSASRSTIVGVSSPRPATSSSWSPAGKRRIRSSHSTGGPGSSSVSTLSGTGDRQDRLVELRRRAPVQLRLGTSGRLALGERRQVHELNRTARFIFQARSRPRKIGAVGVDPLERLTQAAILQEVQHCLLRAAAVRACRLRHDPYTRPAEFKGLAMASSAIRDDFAALVGNTPLVRLKLVSAMTGCEILGKCEFLNPGGSVKDRAARHHRRCRGEGPLRPGGVIVEGTAGNTGIGLALVGNTRGYRTVIVIPDTQSAEKMDMLRLAGAELRPSRPSYRDPNKALKVAGRLAEELARSEPNGAIWANQFNNVANRMGHYRTTGPEVWEQTAGTVTPSPVRSAPAARWPVWACS